ncbi:MAG: hypothetical protein MUC47_04860 [Candidatus Kapabacteria bacterium]|jgi:hypothetical protein|nr:hypothetical protein [Candidatus Kapabacteria bacterium]
MLCCLFFPDYAALAARLARRTQAEVAIVAHGRVTARTPGLRAAGLAVGERVDRLRALFPEAVIEERRPIIEQTVWDDVLDHCNAYSPFVESIRQGIVLFDHGQPHIVQQLAESFGVRSAMAETRTSAVLAAIQTQEGSCRITRLEDLSSFAMAWPVHLLADLGVDSAIIERLELFGLTSLGHIRMLTERHLCAQFGRDGAQLHKMVQSLTDRAPIARYVPPPIIDEAFHFDDPQREPGPILAAVLHCVDRAVERLQNRRCCQMDVRSINRMSGTVVRASRILKSPLQTQRELRNIATILLRDIVGPTTHATAVAVTLRVLLPPEGEQLALFAARPDITAVAGSVLRRFPDGVQRINVVASDAYLAEDAFTVERWA